MTSFVDGPAAGHRLSLRRCPTYLRVVVDRKTGKLDALDQALDEPRPSEDVFAYRLVQGSWGVVFVRPGGRYEYGEYRFLPNVPVGAMRTRAEWGEWVVQHHAKEGRKFSRRLEEIKSDSRA